MNDADLRMRRLGKRIAKVYQQARDEMTDKINKFMDDFDRLDKVKAQAVAEGKMTEAEYKKWRQNKILMSEKYMDLRDTIADKLLHADEIAAQYINGELPGLYAHNYNEVVRDANAVVKGFSFDITDEHTVRNLATQDKTLLPYKFVDGRRATRWNTKHVNSAVMQSVLQGEGSKKLAKRLMDVTNMNRASAIRNARTALTSAQNKGRMDGMKDLSDEGIIIEKEWLATTGDGRTREAHLELHHVRIPFDQPFITHMPVKGGGTVEAQIMFPGDPDADPCLTYNCRCTLAQRIVGVRKRKKDTEESGD